MASGMSATGPLVAALVVCLVVRAASGARVGLRSRELSSSGIVVKSNKDSALENTGRRMLVSVSDYTTGCIQGDYKAYSAPDYDYSGYDKYSIKEYNTVDEQYWTLVSYYSDFAYLSFFVADVEGDDYQSSLDINYYYDSSSGSNVGVILGAVFGALAAVVIGAAGALFILRRRRQLRAQTPANPEAPGPAIVDPQDNVVYLVPPAGSSSKSLASSDLPKAVSPADSWAYASRPPPEAMFPPIDLQGSTELKDGAAMAATAVAAPASMPLSSPANSAGSLSRRTTSGSGPITATDPLLQYVTSQLVTASAAAPRSAHDLAAWELRFEDLDISSFLGEGSWGRVYKAQYHGDDVAVKILLNDDKAVNAGSAASLLSMSSPVLARLGQEASIMAQLSHPHCIAMIGVTTLPAAVIQEFAARGSLLDVLRTAKTDPAAAAELTWARRISICIGTAKGMAYLHGSEPQPVVHRDLKSANVLLTHDWTPKVADFGLSKVMTESARSATRAAMNPRWLSPEILKGAAAAPPADVFAFGVVLWELLTWDLPWGTTGPWVIVGALGAGERPPIPLRTELPGPPGTADWEGLDAYLALMQRCWAQEPQDRPSFDEIIQELEAIAPPLPLPTVTEASDARSPPQTPLSPASTASGRSSRSLRPSSASADDPWGRPPWR